MKRVEIESSGPPPEELDIELNVGGRLFHFWIPQTQELWFAYECVPLLDTERQSPAAFEAAVARAFKSQSKGIEAYDRLLVACAIRPKLVLPNVEDIPVDHVSLRTLHADERDRMAAVLLREAGFTREAAERIRPLSRTGEASSISTASAVDTAEPPANESAG